MCMSVPTGGLNIRFLDSLNFLPMPLAQLPKSFGLEELKKGFFPHFFNTPENQEVILLNLPDIKYYDPDSMSKDRRNEFLDWYELHKNDPGTCLMWLYSYFLEDVIARGGRSLLVVYFVLPLNYLSEWSPMEQRAPAQWFVTRPVSLRSLKTGTTQIPFLLILHLFIA